MCKSALWGRVFRENDGNEGCECGKWLGKVYGVFSRVLGQEAGSFVTKMKQTPRKPKNTLKNPRREISPFVERKWLYES